MAKRSDAVRLGSPCFKDSTLGGFVMSNLDATAREIEEWFFDDYVPTWVKAARNNEDESFIFQYYSLPIYWNGLGVNDWLTTEAAVRAVIDLQQGQLQDQRYDHTNIPDRRIIAYNENGGAVDAIWSRVRADESEVMHLVVHFEIARLKGKGWRVIAVQGTDDSKKNALNQVFSQLY
jgi:hypothetical protein